MASIDLHTGIISSPKHAPLSDAAFRLWTHGLMWSKEHLTDGFIPAGMLPSLHRHAVKYLPELLRVIVPGKGPLWHEVEGGYHIHDYEHWQETKDRIQSRRLHWREKKAGQRGESHRVSPRDTRGSLSISPSDGSGGGSGSGKRNPPTPKGDALFDRFWQAYPRRTAPARALKAWKSLKPDESLLDAMIAAIRWQSSTDQWQRGIIPHPASWLNARRWEDEHPDGAINGTRLDADAALPAVDWGRV
jgi:hypothetical protein